MKQEVGTFYVVETSTQVEKVCQIGSFPSASD